MIINLVNFFKKVKGYSPEFSEAFRKERQSKPIKTVITLKENSRRQFPLCI